jgi:epsilon-lactone hydrolase
MTAVRRRHHRPGVAGIRMGAMDDRPATEAGRVLPLPPAPDGIELRHLRAFVAVAEELNFGRAAARLYLSQPALSRQIRGLERLVGCDLLRRSTHQVELTLAGEALLDRARNLLHGVDDAVSATRAVGGELAGRLARIWEPVNDLTSAGADLQELRNGYESLHAQFAPPPEVDVRPVNTGGVPSLLLTTEAGREPTMLFLHGGGYVMGSAFGYRHLAGALAVAAGTSAVVPEFRLAPEHPFPAALEDAMRAYLWMLDSGTDPGRIILAGDSAGGGLAVAVMLGLKEERIALPGGAILMCPGVDLTFEHIDELPSEPQPALSLEQLRSFVASYLDGHPLDDPLVSPLLGDLTGLPPMLIQGGIGDVMVEDAQRLAERARSHGVETHLELYPVTTHDFHVFWSFLPEAADALQQAGAFARGIRSVTTGDRQVGG